MKSTEQEYAEALEYLQAKLSQPEAEVDQWLNSIVDAWEARRKAGKPMKKDE